MSAAASSTPLRPRRLETYSRRCGPRRTSGARAFIDLLIAEALFGFSYAQFVLLPKLLAVGYGATAGQIGASWARSGCAEPG